MIEVHIYIGVAVDPQNKKSAHATLLRALKDGKIAKEERVTGITNPGAVKAALIQGVIDSVRKLTKPSTVKAFALQQGMDTYFNKPVRKPNRYISQELCDGAKEIMNKEHQISFSVCLDNDEGTVIIRRLKREAKKILLNDNDDRKIVIANLSNNLKNVIIIVSGHQYFLEDGKPSSYDYVLIERDTGRTHKDSSMKMKGETSNRAMIIGMMDAINTLRKDEKYNIQIYTKGSWGFVSMIKKKSKGINGDLLETLKKLIDDREYTVEAFEDANLVNKYIP
ncbi:hypothetical protein [Aquibacillus saliphilus]|uniref:hypothetical protein n=1 Tax=Aquibacillus saliphilus TaxID=1909422 RepID=UPI001CF0D334|nr:hypothetical protein [Aquibacillus saliphilus]